MFYSPIEAAPIDTKGLLVEEINFLGGHFNHIVDRNKMLRMKRIDEANRALGRRR